MPKNVIIIGCTSAIAEAAAKRFALDGDHLFIHGRNGKKLDQVEKNLIQDGAASVTSFVCDLSSSKAYPELVSAVQKNFSTIDIILISHGVLPEQEACQDDLEETMQALTVNSLSTISLLISFSRILIPQNYGTIAVITSVAGLRGRQSNYVYGASKGVLNIYLQGLRNRLHHHGIRVITILPGTVYTPMTSHMKKSLLGTYPDNVGGGIYTAIKKGKDIVYLPWYWRFIMLAGRLIPEGLFKRLKL